MKNFFALLLILGLVACTHKEEAKSIDYYVAHIDEAKTVLQDCQDRIKTASDLPKVMSEENCANARLAHERWINEYTKGSGKTPARGGRAIPE